jgi:hypothetical protein
VDISTEGQKPVDASASGVPTILNLSSSSVPGQAQPGALQAEITDQFRRMQVGANWFFWIAGLSIFNSVIGLFNGSWGFLAGLGVTQFIDAFAKALSGKLGGVAIAIALLLDLITAAVVASFGVMARRGHSWAFVLGLILYAVDGLLFLVVQDWLSIAFHAYASYCIYRGLVAAKRLSELQPQYTAV